MSHRESGHLPPFITGCNLVQFGDAGSYSIVIDGTRFATGMEVIADPLLGTISNVVVTHPTATSGRVTFTLTALAPPSSPANRNITLSNAGTSNEKSVQSVNHGFSAAGLIDSTTPDGAFYDSTDASKNTFYSNNGLSQWDSSAGAAASLVPSTHGVTSAPTTFPNSSATRGFSGAAKTSYQTYGPEMRITAGTLNAVGNGNPWSLGMVVSIPQSAIDLANETFKFHGDPNGLSIGFISNTDAIWASQREPYNTSSIIEKTGVTAGTYVIIATQDGTSTGLKLFVNGVDQGAQSGTSFGSAVSAFKLYGVGQPEIIHGDILIMERALTSAEVANLNTYWTNKFT